MLESWETARVSLPRIYLMADYTSSSLWTDEPEHLMVSLDDLPLSEETKAALEGWSERLWVHLDHDSRLEEDAAHEAEGRRLWAAVRTQLADRYEVGYATFEPARVRDNPHEWQKSIVWRLEHLP